MEFGVQHYLLKPCSEAQIEEVLGKAAASCERKRQSREREDTVTQRERILRTAREMGAALATGRERSREIMEEFLNTPFEGGRHIRRVEKIPMTTANDK